MKKMQLIFIIGVLIALFNCTTKSNDAGKVSINFINNTGIDITSAYVKLSDQENWSVNLFTANLLNNQSRNIAVLQGEALHTYDIRIVSECGTVFIKTGIFLIEGKNNLIYTFNDTDSMALTIINNTGVILTSGNVGNTAMNFLSKNLNNNTQRTFYLSISTGVYDVQLLTDTNIRCIRKSLSLNVLYNNSVEFTSLNVSHILIEDIPFWDYFLRINGETEWMDIKQFKIDRVLALPSYYQPGQYDTRIISEVEEFIRMNITLHQGINSISYYPQHSTNIYINVVFVPGFSISLIEFKEIGSTTYNYVYETSNGYTIPYTYHPGQYDIRVNESFTKTNNYLSQGVNTMFFNHTDYNGYYVEIENITGYDFINNIEGYSYGTRLSYKNSSNLEWNSTNLYFGSILNGQSQIMYFNLTDLEDIYDIKLTHAPDGISFTKKSIQIPYTTNVLFTNDNIDDQITLVVLNDWSYRLVGFSFRKSGLDNWRWSTLTQRIETNRDLLLYLHSDMVSDMYDIWGWRTSLDDSPPMFFYKYDVELILGETNIVEFP